MNSYHIHDEKESQFDHLRENLRPLNHMAHGWLSLAFLILAKTGKAILQHLSASIALIPFILIQLLSIINEFFYLKYTVSENEKHNYLIDYIKIIGDVALMTGAVSLISVSFGAPFSVTIIGYSFFIGGFLQFSIWEIGEGWHKFLEAKKTFLFDLEGLGGLEGLKEILVKTCNILTSLIRAACYIIASIAIATALTPLFPLLLPTPITLAIGGISLFSAWSTFFFEGKAREINNKIIRQREKSFASFPCFLSPRGDPKLFPTSSPREENGNSQMPLLSGPKENSDSDNLEQTSTVLKPCDETTLIQTQGLQ